MLGDDSIHRHPPAGDGGFGIGLLAAEENGGLIGTIGSIHPNPFDDGIAVLYDRFDLNPHMKP